MYWVTLSYWVRLWIQIILSLNQARADKRSRQNTEMTWGIPQLLNQIEYIATEKAEGGQYDPFPYTFYNTKVWSCYRAHSSVEILFYAHFGWTFSMLFYMCTYLKCGTLSVNNLFYQVPSCPWDIQSRADWCMEKGGWCCSCQGSYFFLPTMACRPSFSPRYVNSPCKFLLLNKYISRFCNSS